MKKKHIDFLEKSTKINRTYFPMDIYFLEENKINSTKKQTLPNNQTKDSINHEITVKEINYTGSQRLSTYSPLSLIIDPNLILNE